MQLTNYQYMRSVIGHVHQIFDIVEARTAYKIFVFYQSLYAAAKHVYYSSLGILLKIIDSCDRFQCYLAV